MRRRETVAFEPVVNVNVTGFDLLLITVFTGKSLKETVHGPDYEPTAEWGNIAAPASGWWQIEPLSLNGSTGTQTKFGVYGEPITQGARD